MRHVETTKKLGNIRQHEISHPFCVMSGYLLGLFELTFKLVCCLLEETSINTVVVANVSLCTQII